MAASFIDKHPELRPFLFENVRPTGTIIGVGSYGSVVEVQISGARCAAKKIHDFFQDPPHPSKMPHEGIEMASREFVGVFQLMSTLRHPHIVQFLGLCILQGSRLPTLVMEKLLISLHEVLDPEPEPPTKSFVPLSLKCSILHNVASGLAFLHSRTPAIVHHNLSARNVLLTEGMVAKIADSGMARIVPSAATMTKAPSASIYMPPEALEDISRYDVTIDIFSIGVLAIFTLSQTFPKPLTAAYMDSGRRMVGRTELERRGVYVQQIQRQLREGHPLIKLIQCCLNNLPQDRPTVEAVLEFLEQARAETEDGEYDVNKLTLVQTLSHRTELLQSQKDQSPSRQLTAKYKQIESLQELIESQQASITQLHGRLQVI